MTNLEIKYPPPKRKRIVRKKKAASRRPLNRETNVWEQLELPFIEDLNNEHRT